MKNLQELLFSPVYAQADVEIDLEDRVSFTNVGAIISNAVVVIMILAGLLVFFFLIIGGFQYITSGGDKAQAEAARDKITYALIGLVIVIGSFAIASLIEAFFGVSIFEFDIPTAPGQVGGTG